MAISKQKTCFNHKYSNFFLYFSELTCNLFVSMCTCLINDTRGAEARVEINEIIINFSAQQQPKNVANWRAFDFISSVQKKKKKIIIWIFRLHSQPAALSHGFLAWNYNFQRLEWLLNVLQGGRGKEEQRKEIKMLLPWLIQWTLMLYGDSFSWWTKVSF